MGKWATRAVHDTTRNVITTTNVVIEKLGDKILYDNDFLSKPDYFKKIDELEFKISEIDQSEEDIIKRYRIQLDVKTSMSKLKQEIFFF
jgi:hypothetical protein